MIQTILLDLGNVIVPVDFARCHAELAQVCPLPVKEIQRRLGANGLVERFETGAIQPEDFMRECCAVLGISRSYAEFWDMWSSIFLPETFIPDDWLAQLRQRKRLMLLSNTNSVHFPFLQERYPHLRHFDDYVLSYQVGALKPSPTIYREAVARAGCRAEECFFTDDVPAFVEAAHQEGLDAVLFRGFEQLQADLRARGVAC